MGWHLCQVDPRRFSLITKMMVKMTLLPIPLAGRLVVEKPADSFTCLPYPSRFPQFSVTLCLSDNIFHMFQVFHFPYTSPIPPFTYLIVQGFPHFSLQQKKYSNISISPPFFQHLFLNQIFLEHIFLWQSGRLDGQHGASKGVCAQAFEGGRI